MRIGSKQTEWDGNRIVRIAALGVISIGMCVWLYFWWNRPPAVQHDNLRYIQLLRTAVSSRSADQVQKVSLVLDKRRTGGQLTEAEHEHFREIIRKAEQGEWTDADHLTRDFELAQLSRSRPSPSP